MLLEDECHKLDDRAVVLGADSGMSYEWYSSALYSKRQLTDETQELNDYTQKLEQVLTHQLSVSDDIATNSAISILVNEVSEQKGRLNYSVSQKCTIHK